jgi:hypothetical protein
VIGRRMTALGACVIGQQYSAATFVSSRFPTRKKKIQCAFKNVI